MLVNFSMISVSPFSVSMNFARLTEYTKQYRDGLRKTAGKSWMRGAENRTKWREFNSSHFTSNKETNAYFVRLTFACGSVCVYVGKEYNYVLAHESKYLHSKVHWNALLLDSASRFHALGRVGRVTLAGGLAVKA